MATDSEKDVVPHILRMGIETVLKPDAADQASSNASDVSRTSAMPLVDEPFGSSSWMVGPVRSSLGVLISHCFLR